MKKMKATVLTSSSTIEEVVNNIGALLSFQQEGEDDGAIFNVEGTEVCGSTRHLAEALVDLGKVNQNNPWVLDYSTGHIDHPHGIQLTQTVRAMREK